jgi:hypothetical protein
MKSKFVEIEHNIGHLVDLYREERRKSREKYKQEDLHFGCFETESQWHQRLADDLVYMVRWDRDQILAWLEIDLDLPEII